MIDLVAVFLAGTLHPPLAATVVSVLKHLLTVWVQRPVVPFPWLSFLSSYFNKTVIEAQIMADRVLPALLIVVVIRKPFHDKLVDSV